MPFPWGEEEPLSVALIKTKAVGLSLVVFGALLWPMGCDRAALQFPPPQQFTWDPARSEDPIPVGPSVTSVPAVAKSSSSEETAGVSSLATDSIPTNWVATANIHSDVRTNRTLFKGPAEPPDSEKFNQIASQLAASIDENRALPETDYVFIEDAVELPPLPASPVKETKKPVEMGSEALKKGAVSLVALAERTLGEELIAQADTPEPVALEEIPETAFPEAPEGSYRLGAGDSLDITVWEMPELARALVIRPDGYISFPLIREIKAAGLSPAELERELENRLSDHLLEPEVSVVVTSFTSKVYYVYGAVFAPGTYPFVRDTTLLQAIISAGGFGSSARFGAPTPYGDLSRIRIIRTHEDGREIITKNLKGLTEKERIVEDIPIQPGDVIYIPNDENLVFVFGEVLQPGIIPITRDSRVLEAILASGGTLPTAKDEQVLMIRPGDNRAHFWCLNIKAIERGSVAHNLQLQNGDIIYVPQKPIAKLAEFVQLYASALQPAMETYLTAWDAWFVHERFSALRRNDFGVNSFNNLGVSTPIVDR
jgi:polysaccharide export outer membrane protein